MGERPRKRWWRGCVLLVLIAAIVIGFLWGPLIVSLWRHGVISGLLSRDSKREYEGTTVDNLRAMRTALLGYEESEGQFPLGTGWMDAIENRLGTDVLKKGEGRKKLIRPELLGEPGKYGYALNDMLAGKYHGDVKDQKTPLVFESDVTDRNAHGDPAKMRRTGGLEICIDGSISR